METTTGNLVPSVEACRLLYCDRSTLSRWVKAGHIEPAFRLPGVRGACLFSRADIERLAAERSVTA